MVGGSYHKDAQEMDPQLIGNSPVSQGRILYYTILHYVLYYSILYYAIVTTRLYTSLYIVLCTILYTLPTILYILYTLV